MQQTYKDIWISTLGPFFTQVDLLLDKTKVACPQSKTEPDLQYIILLCCNEAQERVCNTLV